MAEGRTQPDGWTATPREAALEAEAAFPLELPNVYGFHMRTERAIDLCRHLGIDLPPQTRLQAERD